MREREEGPPQVRRVKLEGGPLDGQEVLFDFDQSTKLTIRPPGSNVEHHYFAAVGGHLMFAFSSE